jgi:predicted metalloprotease
LSLPTPSATDSLLALEPDEVLPSDLTAAEYAEYTSSVDALLDAIDGYWSTWIAEQRGVSWNGPEVRNRPADGSNHLCMGREVTFRGTFFCPDGYFIALEESRQLLPIHQQIGLYGVAVVLSHEYGHAVQQQLAIDHISRLKTEFQADCFAGAWFGWLRESGELDDPETAISQAHDAMRTVNSGDELAQQLEAFTDGFEDGPERCLELYPDEPTDNPVGPDTPTPTQPS